MLLHQGEVFKNFCFPRELAQASFRKKSKAPVAKKVSKPTIKNAVRPQVTRLLRELAAAEMRLAKNPIGFWAGLKESAGLIWFTGPSEVKSCKLGNGDPTARSIAGFLLLKYPQLCESGTEQIAEQTAQLLIPSLKSNGFNSQVAELFVKMQKVNFAMTRSEQGVSADKDETSVEGFFAQNSLVLLIDERTNLAFVANESRELCGKVKHHKVNDEYQVKPIRGYGNSVGKAVNQLLCAIQNARKEELGYLTADKKPVLWEKPSEFADFIIPEELPDWILRYNSKKNEIISET